MNAVFDVVVAISGFVLGTSDGVIVRRGAINTFRHFTTATINFLDTVFETCNWWRGVEGVGGNRWRRGEGGKEEEGR